MSENSRSRVTITLGRSGQVVKRDGIALESSTNSSPVVGSKRSVRDRLGNNVDLSASIVNKRQREDDGFAVNPMNDTHLRKDDLRYKIMRKNMLKQSQNSQQSKMDLRNILSRPAQSSVDNVSTKQRPSQSSMDNISTQQRVHNTNCTRMHHHLELEWPQSRAEETSVSGRSLSLTRTFSQQHIPGFKAQHVSDFGKQHPLKAKEGDRNLLEAEDAVRHVHKESYSRPMVDLPTMRTSSHAASRYESGSAYSPWTLDRLRQRSPGECLVTSRGVLASQRDEEFQRIFPVKTHDDSRTTSYIGKDAFEFLRPVSSSHLTKMAPPAGPMKSVGPMVAPYPSETVAPRSSYLVDDQLTVDSFLHLLGLEKYAILLKAEEVDMYSLKRMGERDLKELGIPMGPRKKIVLALQPNLKQA